MKYCRSVQFACRLFSIGNDRLPTAGSRRIRKQGLLAIFGWLAVVICPSVQAQPSATSAPTNAKGEMAFVSVSHALIHSGPAEDFYPTDQLKHGTAVEVFHQTDSGWAAIRPPKGSFSWVVAADAYLLPGGRMIEITAPHSVSWIGTALGTAKQYRWQVKLQPGEQLALLGEETVMDGDGRESLWYKIAPPSGEFRWIQAGLISREPPARLTGSPAGQADASVVPASAAANGGKSPGGSSGTRVIKSTSNKSPPANPAAAKPAVTQSAPDKAAQTAATTEAEAIRGSAEQAGPSPADESDVQAAGYSEEVLWDSGPAEVVEGGVYFEGFLDSAGHEMHSGTGPVVDSSWSDWQLFEFTDDGLRFPLWERAMNRRAGQYDPLLHDPFSLDMAPRTKGTVMHPVPIEPSPRVADRGRTPWRDPRQLGQLRMRGFPGFRSSRLGASFSALQEAFNRSSGGLNSASDSDTTGRRRPCSGQPRLAPAVDSSSSLSAGYSVAAASGLAIGRAAGSEWSPCPRYPASRSQASTATLMQLQHAVSQMVTQPMMQWNFSPLKQQVQQVIYNGNSPVERGEARLLMERIQAFESLAMRSGNVLAAYPGSGSPAFNSPVVTASYTSPAGIAVPEPAIGGAGSSSLPFDATGWLVPVYAAVQGQPTHAITNDAGQIVAYVTGLPGMNLDRYVNQAIGIHGLKGYLPQFQAAHVEAQNIVRLK